MITPKRFSEALGLWAGSMIAPIFAIGTALRQERIFHARGIDFRAEVKPSTEVNDTFADLADGLAQGDALVRLSPGMWSGTRGILPDVLGAAIRFATDAGRNFDAECSSQDVLLITARRLLTLPMAAISTNQRDFLDNVYRGAAPFEIAGQPGMRLRMVSLNPSEATGDDRFAKLRKAVAEGDAVFRLEVESRKDSKLNSPLVEIRLIEEVKIDDDATAFWPFNVGQGIIPQGMVQWMRPVPYLLSEYARRV